MRPLRFSTVILSLVLVLLAIASAILLTAAYQGAEKAITHEVRQGYKRDQRSLDGLMQAQFKNIQQISLELTKRNELKEGLIIKDELRIRHIIEHFLADGSGRYIDAIVITDDKDGSRIISSNISLLGLQIPLKQISQRYTPLGVWTSIVTEVNDKHYSLLQLSLPIIYGQFGEIIGTLHTFVLLNNNYWISNQLQGIFGSDAISLNDGDLILDELESQPGQLQILRSIDRSINKGVIITKRNILRVHNLRIGKSDNYRVWSLLSNDANQLLQNAYTVNLYYAFALLVILGISVMLLLRYLIRRALHHVTQYAEQVPPNGSPTPFQGGYFSEFIRVGCAVEKMLLRIRERDKHLSSIIDNSPDLIFVRDLQRNFRLVNKNFAKLLNMTQEQLRGIQDKMIFTTDLPVLWLKADQQVVQSHRPVQYQVEIEIEHSLHTFLVSKFPVLDDQNSLHSIGAIATDITNIKQAEERLQLTQQVFSETAEAIIVLDEKQRVLSSNRAFIEMSGFSEGDVATVIHSFLVTHPSILQCLQSGPRWQGEGTLQCFGNRSLPVLVSMTKLSHIDAENRYVILFSDITAMKVAEQQLERLALYDNLTGLPNRSLFKKRLEEALHDGSELLTAVMFIDLDFFKNVNDTYGHSIGDLLLQQVADRLRTCVQVTDTVSRLGGDEFTVILRELLNRDQVKEIALRILSTLGKPYQLDSIHSFISASIGISLAAEDGCDVDTLISHADQAMYQAKERGRNLIQFFDATHSENEQKQHQLEELLREALDKKELFVLYQPRFDIDGMNVLAAEALIRWHHQKYGLISPDEFIPIAEGSDLIINIGRFVLFEACLQAAKWNAQGYQIPISVNLSPRQLYSSDLLQDIKRALKQTGLPSHLLEFEITETTVMENIEQVLPILNQICALGVKFSIDDFGTGYSSLMYLKKLPVDTLKIDRSFIMDIPGDADDENLVSAIIYMAHSLHLRVVAEGVETEKQQHFLREENCDELQGFLLGRPDSADKLKVLVDSLKLMSTRSTV